MIGCLHGQAIASGAFVSTRSPFAVCPRAFSVAPEFRQTRRECFRWCHFDRRSRAACQSEEKDSRKAQPHFCAVFSRRRRATAPDLAQNALEIFPVASHAQLLPFPPLPANLLPCS